MVQTRSEIEVRLPSSLAVHSLSLIGANDNLQTGLDISRYLAEVNVRWPGWRRSPRRTWHQPRQFQSAPGIPRLCNVNLMLQEARALIESELT